MAGIQIQNKNMDQLIEKIKNIIRLARNPEITEAKKDTSFSNAIQAVSDIAVSIRESNKFQLKKKAWLNVFHF